MRRCFYSSLFGSFLPVSLTEQQCPLAYSYQVSLSDALLVEFLAYLSKTTSSRKFTRRPMPLLELPLYSLVIHVFHSRWPLSCLKLLRMSTYSYQSYFLSLYRLQLVAYSIRACTWEHLEPRNTPSLITQCRCVTS